MKNISRSIKKEENNMPLSAKRLGEEIGLTAEQTNVLLKEARIFRR